MKGKLYRFGVAVKEFGERMAHPKWRLRHTLVGWRLERYSSPGWLCGVVISLGLAMRGLVMGCPIGELR